jgi:hypothetical protein
MPASLMTLLHFCISAFRNAANSFGVLPTASAPSSSKRCATSGKRTMRATSADSLLTMACGTPAGATIPWNASAR